MKPLSCWNHQIVRAGLALLILGTLAGRAVAQIKLPDSLKNSPDYWRPPDPESESVFLGRRPNAPLVSMGFKNGSKSLDELGRAVCRNLHRPDYDSLWTLCVVDSEFRVILWPEFPQSRPATGLTWRDAWLFLLARLHAGCSHAARDYGGHVYQFKGFIADTVSNYKNFKIYGGLHMYVLDDQNQQQEWSWIKAIAERKGSFKIYSTQD